MPVPQTIRVNPLDLQKNIAIGVSLPFNAPGVFYSTYTTKDQIKSNLVNLLLTSVGERVMNPNFGCELKRFVFEGISENNISDLKISINNSISLYIPEITVSSIDVISNKDNNLIDVTVSYVLNISNNADQVTVQFN
jgi:phage baseplate assembly protein W